MAGAVLQHQEAMDIELPCTPEEAHGFLVENKMICNLLVLGYH